MNASPAPADASPAPVPPRIAVLAEGVSLLGPMDAPPLRWGILGAGHIARQFARDVPSLTRSTVGAVAARDHDRAAAFAQDLDIGTAHTSYDELIRDPQIDAVYIATINPTHHDLALACIRAGKPVLVEKPITLNAAEARSLVDAATQRGVLLLEGMWTRFLPQFTLLRQIAANGHLGHLVNAHASFAGALPADIPRITRADQGGGALLDVGVYAVSVLHDLLGTPIEVVAAGRRMPGRDVDASATIILRTRDAIGTARCSFEGRAPTTAEFVFERGVVELPSNFFVPGLLRVHEFPAGGPVDESADGVDGAETSEWDATVRGGFQYQAAEFARLLHAGQTQSKVMSWRASIEVMEILDTARASIDVGAAGR